MAMLDWLRFFPYARGRGDAPKATEVRGPYFRKPRPNQWRFGDCVLQFKAPWANPILGFDGNGSSVAGISPGRRDILSTNIQPSYGSSDAPVDEWSSIVFYENSWYFTGPWFTGYEARLRARGILVSADKRSPFAETNLLNPKAFESAIASYLDNSFGYYRSGKRPHFRGPLNWRVLRVSSEIQSIVCDIHYIANGGRDNPDLARLLFIQMTATHFISINFDFGDIDAHDDMRLKPLMELCNSIIDSMHLEVGPATQAEWNKVKSTCPDMSLTDTFAELPWPLYKEKPNKKPREIDITQSTAPEQIIDQSGNFKGQTFLLEPTKPPEKLAEIETVRRENPDLKMQVQETFLPLQLD